MKMALKKGKNRDQKVVTTNVITTKVNSMQNFFFSDLFNEVLKTFLFIEIKKVGECFISYRCILLIFGSKGELKFHYLEKKN